GYESSMLISAHLSLRVSQRTPSSSLFPYTTLFRSHQLRLGQQNVVQANLPIQSGLRETHGAGVAQQQGHAQAGEVVDQPLQIERSEEHTSELQSRENLVCRLLLEKKKTR